MRIIVIGLFCSLSILSRPLVSSEYEDRLQQAVARCEQIDPEEYHTALWMNPDGYQSYYERSSCFLDIAASFREPEFCMEVRQRRAWFSSSWGVSEENCRERIAEKLAADRSELLAIRERYLSGPIRLESLSVERHGNGRNYDFIPRFSGTAAAGYRVTLSLLDDTGSRYVIHENGYHIGGPSSQLRWYVPSADIRQAFPQFQQGYRYRLEVLVELTIGRVKSDGVVRENTIEEVFPAAERTARLVMEAEF